VNLASRIGKRGDGPNGENPHQNWPGWAYPDPDLQFLIGLKKYLFPMWHTCCVGRSGWRAAKNCTLDLVLKRIRGPLSCGIIPNMS
jgi:hypothetical protein